jgi:hypothetical protein
MKKDEQDNPKLFYRISSRAFMIDRFGNEYVGEQLMLALLLHCKGSRTIDAVKEVAELLDDPNIKKPRRRNAHKPRPSTAKV